MPELLSSLEVALDRPRDRLKIAAALALSLWVLAAPCQVAAQTAPLDSVAWLSGCWLAAAGENTTEEVWLQPHGGLMVGMVRSVRSGVATGYELLVLQRVGGRIVLTAHPSGQEPADFRASTTGPDLLRVENPDHDFPRRIEYRQPTTDSLVASVFGGVDDPSPAFELLYARAPCPARPR
jgi:hypothetical protein